MIIKKYLEEISNQERKTYTGIILYDNGAKVYYLNGRFHRTDGPAFEYADGSKYWYYHHQYINVKSQEEFETWLAVAAFE